MERTPLTAIAFDVFGTLVDWRRTIVDDGLRLSKGVDWPGFADGWLQGYRGFVEQVRKGEIPWQNLDSLLRRVFDQLVIDFKVTGVPTEALDHFSLIWHRLQPWPDTVPALTRLRSRFRLGTLSNGNMILLTDMAKFGSLPLDCLLSAELVKTYKPEPAPYMLAAEMLGPLPQQVMYVAAHAWDLAAGGQLGLRTGYVSRPMELGGRSVNDQPDPSFDLVAVDLLDLAAQLDKWPA
jgi:2-haloacid dehalogenase